MLADVCLDRLDRHIRVVLGRDDDGIDAHGTVAVVADRRLRLAVGTEVADRAVTTHIAEALGKTVREPNRHRHEFGRLVACEAEHDALIARALQRVRVCIRAGTCLIGGVDTSGNLGRLRANRDGHATRVAVEADLARGVANAHDAFAYDGGDLGIAARGDLAGHVDEARGDERLDGNARARVLAKELVQDAVRDLVANLVGVTFGDGFRGEVPEAHGMLLSSDVVRWRVRRITEIFGKCVEDRTCHRHFVSGVSHRERTIARDE